MDDRHVVIERDSGSGTGMGVVLGVILAIVVALAVMWFVFGANMFGAGAGSSQSNPKSGTDINITVPQPEINVTVPKPDVNVTVPNQQPVAPAKP